MTILMVENNACLHMWWNVYGID